MAVATKAAAFAILIRLFDHALGLSQLDWGPALAFLAATTIVIGNVGALAQRSLKRMLAWSSVAQAGYLLAGVVVGTELGVRATAFHLAVYLLMNVAAFAGWWRASACPSSATTCARSKTSARQRPGSRGR